MVVSHFELEVYRKAFRLTGELFRLTKRFPKEETYSLTDQIRRSSRSVCANIAEAWRKRRYPASFVSKLTDSEGEAAETQTWIQIAVDCGYLSREEGKSLVRSCDEIIRMLASMARCPEKWCYPSERRVN